MQYEGPIRRVETRYFGRPGHEYRDANNHKIDGVTTIIGGGWPKPGLVHWASKNAAEYAINNREDIVQRLNRQLFSDEGDYIKARDELLSEIKNAPYRDRDAAANRGTEVHNLAEQLVQGIEVDVPPELDRHVAHYIEWLDAFNPDPLMTECVVYNLEYGYAGSLDLVARMGVADPKTWLIDLKTTRSGVFNETGLQLAAYKFASHFIDENGEAQPMPHIDELGVIWVTEKGWKFQRVTEDHDFLLRVFRHVSVVHREQGRKDSFFEPLEVLA